MLPSLPSLLALLVLSIWLENPITIDEAHKQQCRIREHQAWLKFFAGKAQLARCDLSSVSTKASSSITASILTSFRGSGFAVSLIEVGLPYWTIN
jgi:hypothetical protein